MRQGFGSVECSRGGDVGQGGTSCLGPSDGDRTSVGRGCEWRDRRGRAQLSLEYLEFKGSRWSLGSRRCRSRRGGKISFRCLDLLDKRRLGLRLRLRFGS
jgi:hypothetical protein